MNIFDLVREDLERTGWHQGSFYNHTGLPREEEAACLVGGFDRVAARLGLSNYQNEMEKLYEKIMGSNFRGAADWNDRPERTWEDVSMLLKELAAEEEE